jgi:2-polyprenyl-6-methoxyphenol hydroxylase-like FAD-dependent oxidoreductase
VLGVEHKQAERAEMSTGYAVCAACDGEGDVAPTDLSDRQKRRLAYKGTAPRRQPCNTCAGRGVVVTTRVQPGPTNPRVAVIGGGLAGCACALALRQRGVACAVYEGDASQNARPQGYALTLQQGARALRQLGVAVRGTTPKGHASFDRSGGALGAYAPAQADRPRSRARAANVVCPRRRVRDAVAAELRIQYGRRCASVDEGVVVFEDGSREGSFAVVVGADGVRSRVAQAKPAYLGYVVALGIAPSDAVPEHLRSFTWQCLDGAGQRMYSMPFDGRTEASTDPGDSVRETGGDRRVMWQFSWREAEGAARRVARAGGCAIRTAALAHVEGWAAFVPALVAATAPEDIVAYALVDVEEVRCVVDERTVVIGDAAHAMSPFKGQGANQALVDGVELAKCLYRVPALRPPAAPAPPRGPLALAEALADFEQECVARVTPKLALSRANAHLTHAASALAVGDVPRADAARAHAAADVL